MMIYSEFKDFVITHLWKNGDSVVIAALDTIIFTAESELDRLFKVEDRATVVALEATGESVALPTDYRTLRSLSPTLGNGSYKYLSPADFAEKKGGNTADPYQFTVVNKTLYLVAGGTVDEPLSLDCWYYRKVPHFAELGSSEESWLAEDYFDVYLYAVLKHTAPFLREDERIPMWQQMYGDAVASAEADSLERKYAGSPLSIKFPKGVK